MKKDRTGWSGHVLKQYTGEKKGKEAALKCLWLDCKEHSGRKEGVFPKINK